MYKQEETDAGSQAQERTQGQVAVGTAAKVAAEAVVDGRIAGEPAAARGTSDIASAAHPFMLKGSQGPLIKPLHMWIIIVLLALILVVSSVGLVFQVMPTNIRGGGANFIPDQSFQGGQSQGFERPENTDAS
jgi:hypothetical protein